METIKTKIDTTKKAAHSPVVSFLLSMSLISFALCVGCAPKPIVSRMPATYNPPGELMEKADRSIKAEDYETAVRQLDDLLFKYPDSAEADDALMKKGIVLKKVRQYGEARFSFGKLIQKFPRSPFAEEAKYEILETFLLEGDNEQVILKASELFPQARDGSYPLKVLLIAGDAHLALGNAESAVRLYTMAFTRAPDSRKDEILKKVRDGIARIPTNDLEFLAKELPNSFPKGYIMYQLGLNKTKEGKFFEAQTAFTDFARTFPDHPDAPAALEQAESIRGKADEERFTIGCLLPLSGKYEELGQKAWTGIELAMGEFGAREGAPTVRVVVKDTGSDPERAVEGVRELAKGHSAVIIGPMATSEAAAREAQNLEIPIIAMTLKENIAEHGDYVFRNFLTAKMQAESMVAFLTESLGLTRFAVLYPEENYGKTFMNLFWEQVFKKGGTVAGAESYGPNLTDYKGPIGKLSGLFRKASGNILGNRLDALEEKYEEENGGGIGDETAEIDASESMADFGAIFIPDSIEKAGMILPQLSYYNISGVYILGTNLWHNDKFVRITKGYSNNVIVTDGFFARSKNPQVRSFVESYGKAYGEIPGFIEAVAYDTAMLAMETMVSNNISSRTRMKDTLLGVRDFPGVTGKTSFGPDGDAVKNVYILRAKDGGFVELKNRERRSGE